MAKIRHDEHQCQTCRMGTLANAIVLKDMIASFRNGESEWMFIAEPRFT